MITWNIFSMLEHSFVFWIWSKILNKNWVLLIFPCIQIDNKLLLKDEFKIFLTNTKMTKMVLLIFKRNSKKNKQKICALKINTFCLPVTWCSILTFWTILIIIIIFIIIFIVMGIFLKMNWILAVTLFSIRTSWKRWCHIWCWILLICNK